MQAPFDNIVQHLFHQPSLHSVTVEELENMAQQYPYFAAAHFLLLKKMQDTAHPAFTDQLHKTAIYFNNPMWLQYLLQPETVPNFSVSEESPFIDNEPMGHSAPVEEENSKGQATGLSIKDEDPATPKPFTTLTHEQEDLIIEASAALAVAPETMPEEQGMMDIITAAFGDPNPLYSPIAETDSQAANAPAQTAGEKEEAGHSMPLAEAEEFPAADESVAIPVEILQAADESIAAPENEILEPPPVNAQQVTETIPQEAPIVDAGVDRAIPENSYEERDTGSKPIEISNDEPATDTAGPGQIADMNMAGAVEEAATETTTEEAGTGNPTAATAADETPLQSHDDNIDQETFPTETSTGERPLLRTIIETPAAKDDLLFEPYHTVDYFASQGIKLGKLETDPKDKLGRQLKSFTDWLKTMKKLPQASIDKLLAQNEESKVVEDANHSIENKEVITEAMAEVFEKQGLHEKAAEIYRKLSLLNPPKSAYFAGRIEALKH